MNENDMKTEQSKVRLPAEGSLILSSSPHLRTGDSTHKVMLLVILALIPAVLASVWFFGWNALRVVVYCMAFCALFEYLWCVLAKTGSTLSNLSALVTGLILALNVSPLTPWWLCLAGAFIAIIVAKQVFGGLGQNPFNPAAVARVAMLVGATGPMTMWMNPAPGAILGLADKVDAVASATPLAAAKAVAGNAACSIQVNAVKAFHDVNMVRDGIIRHNRIAKALYFHIAAVVRAGDPDRRDCPDRTACDPLPYSAGDFRDDYGIRLDCESRQSRADAGADVPSADRRRDDRRVFHGDGYGDFSRDASGRSRVRCRYRRHRMRDPYLGVVPRGDEFCDCDYECAGSADR